MAKGTSTPRPCVLVVDDQATQRLLAAQTLRRGDFDVLEAQSGAEALAMLAEHDVAAMVVDVMMPEMDGFELCRRVRAEPRGRYLPIMMMTARDDQIAIEQAFDAGATDFVSKPVNPLILNNRMRYMLRGASTLEELRRNETLLGMAEDVALSGSWECADTASGIRCSKGFLQLFDIGLDEACGLETFLGCFPPAIAARIRELTSCAEAHRLPLSLEHAREGTDGSLRHFETRIDRRIDLAGQRVVCGVTQEITQRRAAEQEIRQLAYFDSLTGLPNRALFAEHLRQMVKAARRNGQRFALLHVDVDEFKRINKLADRGTGDRILGQIAERIRDTLRVCDVVTRTAGQPINGLEMARQEPFARVGGDEFIVAMSGLDRLADVETVCRRILGAINQPYEVDGRSYQLSACLGVAAYPDHGTDAEGLLMNADSAVSEAKNAGRNQVQIYSRDIHERVMERLTIANDLRSAVESGELEVYYQPRVDIHRNQIVGMEALVRWIRDGNVLTPDRFIPIAEESDLIDVLGEFVLRRACEQVAALRAEGFPQLELGVNLSARQLENPKLLDEFASILEDAGMPAELLCLELTESALMHHADRNVEVLQAFRRLGCKVAVDDFGTGYSSLNYLKRFPIDILKIDRSFVVDLESSHDDGNIVTAVVRLAQTLGLTVVAEGVETENQKSVLKRLGCDEVQGYLYSRPLAYEAFAAWLRERLAVSTVLRA